MTNPRFRPDRGLTLRVTEAWLVLLLITAAYGVLAGLIVQGLVGWPWWIGLVSPIVAGGLTYLTDDGSILPKKLTVIHAHPEDEPRLYATMARLCSLADVSVPRLKVIEAAWPNAITLRLPGRRPTVAVTRGLLDTAAHARLEAVLAHELAHLIHRDASVMTIASNLAMSVVFAPFHLLHPLLAADPWICRLARRCGFGWEPTDDDHELPPPRAVPPTLKVVFGATVLVVLGVLRAALFAAVLAFALTVLPVMMLLGLPGVLATARLGRYREFAADRTAAMLTAQPAHLAAALTALDGSEHTVPKGDLRELNAVSSMTIVPLPPEEDTSEQGRFLNALERILRTHPPVQHRLDHLAEVSRDLSHP